MRALTALLVWSATLVFLPSVLAGEPVPAAYQSCIACHGAAGEGSVPLGAPALAGQDASYLQRQLENFKEGRRGGDSNDGPGAQMKAMSSAVSDADIPILASYLAGLPDASTATTADGDMRNGSNYYQSSCGACHGGKAQGNSGLNSPNLAILDGDYLTRQMEDFQKGLRGSDPKDRYGLQMKMMSTTLPTDKDLTDVLAFIQSLGGQ
ncbi:MAG: cytochrome c553 [Halioglobus sp.]|jgi:cytochrome c553